jgi:hypothetical protein
VELPDQPCPSSCLHRAGPRRAPPEIAAAVGITERTAYGIVDDLTKAGYVVKDTEGRRNRYRIESDLPLREAVGPEQTIGHLLGVFVDSQAAETAQVRHRNAASDRGVLARTRRAPGS